MAIQSEKSGAGQSEEFVASRVQVVARWSEKDKGLLQTQCQFADHTVSAPAIPWARKGSHGGGFLLEKRRPECFKVISEMAAPNCRQSGKAGNGFKRAPG